MRYYVAIYGPGTTGVFGADSLVVASPADVQENEVGSLIVHTAPRPAGPPVREGLPPVKARGPEVVIYGRGQWTKVRIGQIVPRR